MRAAVTTRAGGASGGNYASLNMGFLSGDEPERVIENRRRALLAFLAGTRGGFTFQSAGRAGYPPPTGDYSIGAITATGYSATHGGGTDPLSRWTGAKQVHGTEVFVAYASHAGSGALSSVSGEPGGPLAEADAICTDSRGLVLTIQVADCVPVVVFDEANGAIGVAHCGWRGAAARVLDKLLETMGGEYGTLAKNVFAGIGPGICGGCMEVGGEVASRFLGREYEGYRIVWNSPEGGREKYRLNLPGALHAQLTGSGVPHANIETMVKCSVESPELLYSYRRDGAKCGRNALFAMLC